MALPALPATAPRSSPTSLSNHLSADGHLIACDSEGYVTPPTTADHKLLNQINRLSEDSKCNGVGKTAQVHHDLQSDVDEKVNQRSWLETSLLGNR